MSSSERKILYEPESVSPLRAVKSTLVASSRSAVAARGYAEQYRALLSEEDHTAILEASMGNIWIPKELARAHYQACNDLNLDHQTVLDLGGSVAEKIAGPFFGTVVRVAKSGGMTPWTPLGRVGTAWGRAYQGSAVAVHQLGPKEAELRILQNELGSIHYWVTALGALIKGIAELFSRKAYCRTMRSGPSEVRYLISWA